MGYYHVNRQLKGKYIKFFDIDTLVNTIPDSWLPDENWVNVSFPQVKQCNYGTLEKKDKLILLGCIRDMPWCYNGPKTLEDLNYESIQKIYNEPEDKKYVYLAAIGLIFCYHYEYPLSAFECLSDYDDTWMFMCTVQFPPKEYNEKLSKLTEEIYAKQLSEYLSMITGKEYQACIEICEEYIKE